MDFIGDKCHGRDKHADQLILIFNMLLSEHVLNGNIDLTGQSALFIPELSDGEEPDSDSEPPVMPELFHPNLLLDRLTVMPPVLFQEVNKQAIINLIAKSMALGNPEVKQKVVHIFRTNLLMGQNFHYEVSNRHL